jgi:hypothetical protein
MPALGGLDEIEVGSDALAAILADADGRLAVGPGAGPGVALLSGRRIRLSSQPGERAAPQEITDPTSIPAAVGGWSLGEVHAAAELDLLLDLAAPAPSGLEPWTLDLGADHLITLSPTLAEFTTMLLVGPGVARAGQGAAVAEAARRTGAGIVATFGAVGVVPVDDPAWCGVVGLQRDDPALSGLDDAELVITAGVDPTEAVDLLPDTAQVLDLEPWQLGLMASHWPDPTSTASGSTLTRGVAALADRLRSADGGPARAAVDVLDAARPGALVAADAGPAGLWVARGLAASAATVVVPALPAEGFAVAAAFVAGLDGRPAVAVTTAPTDACTEALVELAERLGVALVVEVWGAGSDPDDSGAPGDPEHRAERLRAAVAAPGVHRLAVAVDPDATDVLVELAGPVTAWTGRP